MLMAKGRTSEAKIVNIFIRRWFGQCGLTARRFPVQFQQWHMCARANGLVQMVRVRTRDWGTRCTYESPHKDRSTQTHTKMLASYM